MVVHLLENVMYNDVGGGSRSMLTGSEDKMWTSSATLSQCSTRRLDVVVGFVDLLDILFSRVGVGKFCAIQTLHGKQYWVGGDAPYFYLM